METNKISEITCVSGYWKIKNKHDNKFDKWLSNSLKINCPYIFFCEKEMIPYIKNFRNNLPTYFIECSINDFYTYKYKNKMITHPIHCPSVELNLVWNEKIFLIKKAYELNPFQSNYFCWIDAGICVYREKKPPNYNFSDLSKIKELPKDKFIYSSSSPYNEINLNMNLKTYNHSYSHHISGTFYILHKNIINTFVDLYKKYLEKLIDNKFVWTDQIILTHIYKDNKNLFYKLCDGYAENILYLFRP